MENLENEIWVNIEGFYSGRYKISSNGNLKRTLKTEAEVKIRINKDGYYQTVFCKNRNKKTVLIHRVVAQAFVPNPDNKPEVNHINGVKTDNRVENLEWCTSSENLKHAYRTGLKTQDRSKNPHARKVINRNTGDLYGCIDDARILTKYTYNYFYSMLRGKFKNNTEFEFYPLNSNQ